VTAEPLAGVRAAAVREARTTLMAQERLHAHNVHPDTAVAGTGLTAWCLGCRWAEALERYADGVEEGG
jgi:hypothetical protein